MKKSDIHIGTIVNVPGQENENGTSRALVRAIHKNGLVSVRFTGEPRFTVYSLPRELVLVRQPGDF